MEPKQPPTKVSPKNPPSRYRWPILLVLLTLLVRLPAIVHPKPIDDEGGYAVIANELLHGRSLYIDVVERKPPLLFWTYAAIFKIFGVYRWPPLHLAATAWILLTMWGLYAVAKTLFDRNTGLAAALFYTIAITPSLSQNLAFNGEVMMNLPIVWAYWAAFRQSTARYRPELILSGVLLCCAFFIKQPAAVAAIPLGIYLLLPSYRAGRRLNVFHSFAQACILTVSYFTTLAAFVLILHHQGILEATYYWIVSDHDLYHGPTDSIFWQLLILNTLGYLAAWHPLVIVGCVSLWQCCSRGPHYWQSSRPEYIALLLLLVFSFIGVSASGRFYSHYYIQLLPAMTLLGAPVLSAIWTGKARYRFFLLRPRVLRGLLAFTTVAFLAINTFYLWQYRPENELVGYLRRHSSPQDKVFFWGRDDNLYAEAERRPASRYIHYYPLTGYIWGSPLKDDPNFDTGDRIHPGAWDALKAEFSHSPPAFIIDADPGTPAKKYPPDRFPYLHQLLTNDYQEVFACDAGKVYKRTDSK